MLKLSVIATSAIAFAMPAVAQQGYPLSDPCRPLTVGTWVYQGLVEARQRACQQVHEAADAAAYTAQRDSDARAKAIVQAHAAAENSPDNTCRDPATAGMLLKGYNGLPWGYPPREVVDIEHLVTIANSNGVLSCHGIWIHTNARRLEGTLTFKPNVAGDMIITWTQESWQPPVTFTPPPPVYLPSSPQPLTPVYTRTSPQAPTAAIATTAFQQGLSDRRGWETWFASLSGEYRSGAYFWTGQRSLPQPQACAILGGEATTGCLAAQVKLAPTDARRKSEPEYRLGWNSFAGQ